MEKLFKFIFVVVGCTCLSGCFIPEKFNSTFQFHEDSTFDYEYKGTVVNAFAASEKQKKGAVSEKMKADTPKIIADMKRNHDTQSVSQVSDTTFKVDLVGKNKNSNMFSLMDFIKVHKDQAGNINVFTPTVNEKNLRELQSMGVSIDGSLKITLPKNAIVLESNAQSTVGGYSWTLKKFDEKVILKFKLTH